MKLKIYEELKSEILGCSNCDLCEEGKIGDLKPQVVGQGNLDAKVMFIAQNPGEHEVRNSHPLHSNGKSGALYEKVLSYLGFTRSQVYTSNVVHCLTGNSKILTEDGWKQIDAVVKHQYDKKVACVDNKGDIYFRKIINWHRSDLNDRKLYKLQLLNSRNSSNGITGAILTHDHEVLTQNGYIKICDLGKKDLIHSGTEMPSKDIQEAIIGILLGDGTIGKKNNSFQVWHCKEQKEYSKYISEILDTELKIKNTKQLYGCNIRATPFFRNLRKKWYGNKKNVNNHNLENFSLISLAFLFMDDGHVQIKKNGNGVAQIATCSFNKKENQIIVEKIKKLGIDCFTKKGKKYNRIFFNTENTKILSEKIAPYIHFSMNYKLLPCHRNINKIGLNNKKLPFFDNFRVIRYADLEKRTKSVYCINVEEFSNFITHSGVVHNCHSPKNREPEAYEVMKCKPFLDRQIELVKPELIVTFGRQAAQHFLNDFKISRDHGKVQISEAYGVKIFPLYHPAFISCYAKQSARDEFKVDLAKLKDLTKELK